MIMEKNNENQDKGVKYRLTPKACLGIVLTDTRISPVDLLDDFENRTFKSAFTIFERRMERAGYITDNDGKTVGSENSEEPDMIFSKTIKGFYPDASEEQISAAWELFVYYLDREEHIL